MSEILFDDPLAQIIAKNLSLWFAENGRQLPWRETKDPYKIWLSEVILQQTRIEQGTAYYFDFLKAFPSVEALAQASEEEVLRLWQGLGYYTRARNLRKAALEIVSSYEGVFPSTYDAIRSLPGVGDYTAGAIASFAFGLSYPAVDGNLLRVLSRFFASHEPIDSTKGKKLYTSLAAQIVQQGDAAVINQALMDIGATICTPRSPECGICPLCGDCKVAGLPLATDFPIKKRKVPLKDLYFYFFYLIDSKGNILIEKRVRKDIWRGLYQLPLIESETPLQKDTIRLEVESRWGKAVYSRIESKKLRTRHILSHRRLHLTFFKASLAEPFTPTQEPWCRFLVIPQNELDRYPLPAAIFKHLPALLQ